MLKQMFVTISIMTKHQNTEFHNPEHSNLIQPFVQILCTILRCKINVLTYQAAAC